MRGKKEAQMRSTWINPWELIKPLKKCWYLGRGVQKKLETFLKKNGMWFFFANILLLEIKYWVLETPPPKKKPLWVEKICTVCAEARELWRSLYNKYVGHQILWRITEDFYLPSHMIRRAETTSLSKMKRSTQLEDVNVLVTKFGNVKEHPGK